MKSCIFGPGSSLLVHNGLEMGSTLRPASRMDEIEGSAIDCKAAMSLQSLLKYASHLNVQNLVDRVTSFVIEQTLERLVQLIKPTSLLIDRMALSPRSMTILRSFTHHQASGAYQLLLVHLGLL